MTRGIAPLPETLAVPDTDPVYSTAADLRTVGKALCKVTNGTDKTVAITPQYTTSDDAAFEAAIDGTSQNIAAGATGHFIVTDPWSFVRAKVVAAEARRQAARSLSSGASSTREIEMQQQEQVQRAARRAALKDQERRARAALENGKLCRR